MKIVASIQKLNSKWKSIEAAKLKNAIRELNRGALKIHKHIVLSFVSPKSGRQYSRGSKNHTASAPGEAPARDTGHLGQTVQFRLAEVNDTSPLVTADVTVSAEYALALEFGRKDGSIAERPFVRPAYAANKDQIMQNVRKALSQ